MDKSSGRAGIKTEFTTIGHDFKHLINNSNFVRLFWAQLISSLGDWVATLALMSVAWKISESSLAVGGMLAFRVWPALFSGPVAAAIADRVDRKRILVTCDILRGLIVMVMPFLNVLWYLYVGLFFLESLSIIWLAARDASVPNIVEKKNLTMANSLSMTTSYGTIPFAAAIFSLTMFPASRFIKGSFLAEHPTILAFIFDSLSFFVSAYLFSKIHLSQKKYSVKSGESYGFLESMGFTLKHPFARSLLLAAAMGCLGGGSLYAVGIGYVREVLGAKSDVAFGFLMALFGLGMFAGVIFLQVLVKRREKPYMLRISLLMTGGILVGMSLVNWLPIAFILAGFFGGSFGILFLVAVTMVQEKIEDRDRGKAFAAFHAVSRIFLVTGAGMAGGIAAAVGTRKLEILFFEFHINGISIAMFIAGFLIAAASFSPLGEKKKRYREYFKRNKSELKPGDGRAELSISKNTMEPDKQ